MISSGLMYLLLSDRFGSYHSSEYHHSCKCLTCLGVLIGKKRPSSTFTYLEISLRPGKTVDRGIPGGSFGGLCLLIPQNG